MTSEEARRILDLVCAGRLNIGFSGHFLRRLGERLPGLRLYDVINVLRRGTIRGDPVLDESRGNHKVRVVARVHGFGRVEVVVAVAWCEDAIAVTIYSIDRT